MFVSRMNPAKEAELTLDKAKDLEKEIFTEMDMVVEAIHKLSAKRAGKINEKNAAFLSALATKLGSLQTDAEDKRKTFSKDTLGAKYNERYNVIVTSLGNGDADIRDDSKTSINTTKAEANTINSEFVGEGMKIYRNGKGTMKVARAKARTTQRDLKRSVKQMLDKVWTERYINIF